MENPRLKQFLQTGSCAVVILLTSAGADSAAEPPVSWKQVVQSWVGSWSCVTTGPNGTNTWSETASALGPHWIRFDGYFHAGKPIEALIGYDTKRHQWITIFVSSEGESNYGVTRSSAPQGSMKQTWVDAYPVDPSDGPYTMAMTKSGYVETAAVTVKGHKGVIRDVCSKRH